MSRFLVLTAGVLAAALSFAARAADTAPVNDDVPATAAELAPPLTPAGAPETIKEIGADDKGLQSAAGVQQVDDFSEQSIHLFGVASADPGPIGLHVYARFAPGGAGYAVYPLADAVAYEVVSVQQGKIGIKLTYTDVDGATGDQVERERKIIVSWTENADTGATAVTVTPAK
ncbi:hypothetical protein sos41_34530 [Alphaproteobacteria bacterium SO-S41]|nr:hypothetical protein sos41_34530 [Alphaproteobacteria bacterium SO-S41]